MPGPGTRTRLLFCLCPIRCRKLSKMSTFVKTLNYGVKKKTKRALRDLETDQEQGLSGGLAAPSRRLTGFLLRERNRCCGHCQCAGELTPWTRLPGGRGIDSGCAAKGFKTISSSDAEIPLGETYPKKRIEHTKRWQEEDPGENTASNISAREQGISRICHGTAASITPCHSGCLYGFLLLRERCRERGEQHTGVPGLLAAALSQPRRSLTVYF